MDRHEAVQKLSRGALISIAHAEDLYDSIITKPVVPKYVADWYEGNKKDFDYEIWNYIVKWDDQNCDELKKWFNREDNCFRILVNMHQFGYSVEEETRYQVTFKDFASNFRVLKYHLQFKNWFTGNDSKYDYTRMYHTRKELEDAGFGWVFHCEGIEIEEVE